MTEQTGDQPRQITSRLWKAAQLSRESVIFPVLVEAAAWYLNRTFTDHMVRKVAANKDLVDFIPLKAGMGMDATLNQLAQGEDSGPALDGMVISAVQAYSPPPEPSEPTP